MTGAARGIGLGIAQAFASAGAAVVIQDIDLDVAQAEAGAICRAGGKAIALGGDVTDTQLADELIKNALESLGGLHVLVNNAAIQTPEHWLAMSQDSLDRQLRADLVFPILLAQRAAVIFKNQKWGRIINLGSVQQRRGNPGMLAYSASKAAMEKITTALARDLASDNITVNCIAPGWFDTYRNRADFKDEADKAKKGEQVPLGRIGVPADCQGLAVLLCSPAGSYITGQTIYVDGGMTLR